MGFFVVTHAGLDPISPEHLHADPKMISAVLDRYPGLRLIAAHLGGFARLDGVLEHLVGKKNVWFDTSMSSQRPERIEGLHRILREHDPDRLLFGSDTPWSFAKDEINFIYSAKLGDVKTEKILYKNALALLEDE
jgi:hypothetical protein